MENIHGNAQSMEQPPSIREAWITAALARYEQPLLRYALRITGNREVARDVVQDTFLKLCQTNPDSVEEHLAGWLYTVCRNRALTLREKEARMTPLGEHELDLPAESAPGAAVERKESHARVFALLGTLPQEQQKAFQLKFRDGLTYREISSIMGVSLGTVSYLITTALNAVRRELRPDLNLAEEA